MKRTARVVIVLGASILAGCGAAQPAPARAATDAHDDADVSAGYRAYHDALAAWGTWEQDELYATRWCPREELLSPAFSPLAPASDNQPWRAITTRGGRWIHDLEDAGRWCWIPGVEARGASVVTRAPRPRGTATYAESARPAPPPKAGAVEETAKSVSGFAYDLASKTGSAPASR